MKYLVTIESIETGLLPPQQMANLMERAILPSIEAVVELEEEKKVPQGLGWFLREAWKIKRKETETFLLKWKDRAPRVIFQYATEKMTAEEKKRFRKEKIK